MNNKEVLINNQEKKWISITGYRTLLILKSLMEKNCSMNEIIDILKSNQYTSKSVSKDTIRIAINTLKMAGCIINRPNKKNGNKYELISHPFVLNLTKEEIKTLQIYRDKLAEDSSWSFILQINHVFEKIVGLTCNPDNINEINETRPLLNVNEKLLFQLLNPKVIGKRIQIKYISSQNGEENINIVPYRPVYDNKKLYIWCYIYKYDNFTLLDIEKIIKINNIDLKKAEIKLENHYEVIYKLTGQSVNNFELKDYEEIIEQNNDSLTIKAYVSNEFFFIQRILLFGADFKIISPDFFREKLINKIILIQKGYKDE